MFCRMIPTPINRVKFTTVCAADFILAVWLAPLLPKFHFGWYRPGTSDAMS